MTGFMQRWRDGMRRTRRGNIETIAGEGSPRGRALEGPGSVERLQRLRHRFEQVSGRSEVSPLILGVVMFLTVVVGGLAWPYIAEALRQ